MGGVQILGAPADAQVFADGYYVGVAGDFSNSKPLTLDAGPHQLELRMQGHVPVTVDLNVRTGSTLTYHADIR